MAITGRSSPARSHRHLDDHRPDAAGRDHDEGVMRAEMEALQDFFGISLEFLQMQGRPQAVGAHDGGMIGKREFDQGEETRVTALARRHLLAHHPRVAGAEEKDQPAIGDRLGADFGGLLDLRHPVLRIPSSSADTRSKYCRAALNVPPVLFCFRCSVSRRPKARDVQPMAMYRSTPSRPCRSKSTVNARRGAPA